MHTIVSPHSHNLSIMSKTEPSLRFKGDIPFNQWQNEARAKLKELLGFEKIEGCDPLFMIESDTEHDNMREVRFIFQSEEGYFAPCHLAMPKDAKTALPLVVCLQGHSKGMHVSFARTRYEGEDEKSDEGDRDFALQIVDKGYCALTIEQRNFGECGGTKDGPDCYKSSMAALMLGRTTLAERVWDVMRAIDMVSEHFSDVYNGKTALMGNSGGGTTTYYTACIDERISLAMPSCAICTFDDSIAAIRHCSCNFVPRIREYFNMSDLAGLIAPRKLLVVSGREDSIFPIDGVYKTFEEIQEIYKAAGVPDNCRLVVGEGGHRFYAADAWPVFQELFD